MSQYLSCWWWFYPFSISKEAGAFAAASICIVIANPYLSDTASLPMHLFARGQWIAETDTDRWQIIRCTMSNGSLLVHFPGPVTIWNGFMLPCWFGCIAWSLGLMPIVDYNWHGRQPKASTFAFWAMCVSSIDLSLMRSPAIGGRRRPERNALKKLIEANCSFNELSSEL